MSALVLLAAAAACATYGDDERVSPVSSADAGADASADPADGGAEGSLALDDVGSDGGPNGATTVDDAAADRSAPLADLYVFVTSTTTTGKLGFGSPEGPADRICADLAIGRAKLKGRKFAAWIGIDTSPIDRIAKKAVGHRYVRMDGELVSADPPNMATAGVVNAINLDERGVMVPVLDHAWTGVERDGTPSSAKCGLWGSEASTELGLAGAVVSGTGGLVYGVDHCDRQNHLYCFEVP